MPLAIRVANAPVSWGILEVGEWGKTPYGEFLDQLQALGYQGTELGPWGYLPTDPDALRAALAARGLALAGAYVPVRFVHWGPEELEKVLRTARLLSAAGCQRILIADAGEPGRRSLQDARDPARGLTDAEWQVLAGALREIAAACRPLGLAIAFHHHVGSFVETPEEIERLLSLVDEDTAGLCLDTGHLTWAGGDPVAFARRHGRRIRHLHLKDVHRERLDRAIAAGLDFVTAVKSGIFVPLGQGAVDFAALFQALDEAGYEGWAVVEQDRLGDDMLPDLPGPYEGARLGREFLRRLLGV